MYISKGSTRLVVIFPFMGFVIKFPLPKPIVFTKSFFRALKYKVKGETKLWEFVFAMDKDGTYTTNIRLTLLNGIYHNWKEYKLWRMTRSSFLEPTFFSLFVLINIQKYGKPLEVHYGTLWHQMLNYSNGQVWDNGHHFSNPNNFSFLNGNIKMIDYGDFGIEKVVIKYGDEIVRLFDPNNVPDWVKRETSIN